MIDHFNLPVQDLARSETFYRAILTPLGYPLLMRDGAAVGFGKGAWRFGLTASRATALPMHLAFVALAGDDRLAALAFDPDANLNELRKLYEDDAGLRVPTMVFNALLQRPEAL